MEKSYKLSKLKCSYEIVERKIKLPNCWIFNVKDDENSKYGRTGNAIYNHRMQDCFWGLREVTEKGKRTANVACLKAGDRVLFYLVGKDGHCFLGTCVLASCFRKLEEKETGKFHREWLDWKEGVDLKRESIDEWREPLIIHRLCGKVSFVPIGENYGSHLQGSVKKIDCNEYDIVVREHKMR